MGLDLPLGQRSAAAGEHYQGAVVHPSIDQAGPHGVGDRLLELPANDGGPDLPTVSARRQARGLWRLTAKSLATNAAAVAGHCRREAFRCSYWSASRLGSA